MGVNKTKLRVLMFRNPAHSIMSFIKIESIYNEMVQVFALKYGATK